MRVLRPAFVGTFVISALLVALAPQAGAEPVTEDAMAWLLTQQQDDGGFEVAQFDGFETPDAILAIAAHAQTTGTWSTAEAHAAVDAVAFGGTGPTALDWLDTWLGGGTVPPEQQAKLIVLVAGPLGLDPTDFDPAEDDDPGEGVDLTAGLDAINPGLFNGRLFGRLAEAELGQNVHQRDLQIICEAAKTVGGGWSFDGMPDATNAADLDSTGFAVMALVAAGVDPADPVLAAAETFVTDGQQANGSWLSFGSEDPNATTLAVWAQLALGNPLGSLDPDPLAWLRTQQDDDDHIISPNDAFGVNTFATSQTIQALLLDQAGADWLPRPAADSGRRCIAPDTYTDVPANAWYDDGARWVDDEDIVSGANGALLPKAEVNRAQASMWLNLMFGGPGGDPHEFVDVPDGAWYEDGVNFVDGGPNGRILTGSSDRFRPRAALNRAQAAAWLYAAAGSPEVTGLPAHGFEDVGGTAWYRNAVTWAKAHGVVAGFGDSTFRGLGRVNRGQLTQWMFNLAATPEAWEDGAILPPTILFTDEA